MADILRISTPVVEKNQSITPKPGLEPASEFNLQQSNKVIQTHNQSQLLGQNNAKLQGSDTPTILLNMLKDPDVTVSFLKNISMLEEIYKLLPANNSTVTPEIEQLFHQLLINPEELAKEMQRQEDSATVFKGPFFDFLRNVSYQNASSGETQRAIANLLRSMNNLMCKDDILDAVANSLQYLAKNMNSSQNLTSRIAQLVQGYQQGTMPFDTLKNKTLVLLRDVENSILFSPNLAKTVSITTYNLSRYNDSLSFFQEAAVRLRQLLRGPERQTLAKYASAFLNWVRNGAKPKDAAQAGIQLAQVRYQKQEMSNMPEEAEKEGIPLGQEAAAKQPLVEQQQEQQPPAQQNPETDPDGQNRQGTQQQTKEEQAAQEQTAATEQQFTDETELLQREPHEMVVPKHAVEEREQLPSRVMDALVSMIGKEASREGLSSSEEKRIDNILQSLLSSPCNYTPLLHFVVPAFFEDIRAFAELWINPESDAKDMPRGVDHGVHLLMVIDAEAAGRFEAEVFAHDKIVDLHLFCPPEYEKQIRPYLSEITGALKNTAYRIGQVRLAPLERARSLMDVFKSLPYKRVGVDVTI